MEPVRYARSFWAGLFTLSGSGAIELGEGRWDVTEHGRRRAIDARRVESVSVRRGLFWSTLVLAGPRRRLEFPGLAHEAAEHLRGLSTVAGLAERVEEAHAAWQALRGRRRYLNRAAWSAWQERHQGTLDRLRQAELRWLPEPTAARARALSELGSELQAAVARLNKRHVARELRACEGLLDRVESEPLTRRQRLAIVTDEDNTLVVAGAGTGKTSVVTGKVAYAVERLGVRPDEILLLAYNKDAAAEMQERISRRLGLQLRVSTFHALGLAIVGRAEGRSPAVSALAEPERLASFLDKTLRSLLRSEPGLLGHLVEYVRPWRGHEEFASKHDYIVHLKGAGVRSLRGEHVRSHEECTIADWLYLHGIEYAYERPYEPHVADQDGRPYRPAFTLPGAYLEHFGVDRDGQPAPWLDRERYQQEMAWRRATHRRFGTRLVETYGYDRREGALTERLAERLARAGLRARPLGPAALQQALEASKALGSLARLLAVFLQHFKEGQHTLGSLRGLERDPHRSRSFLAVFEQVHRAYEEALRAEGALDFQDMIGRATAHVAAGRYRSPYRYVIVDEFQDTSRGRARLLRALLDQVPDRRLTCVGDDWQSIYRFAGSDLSHMTRFEEHFGPAAQISLDRSFRFGRRLLAASARFVQENPAQLRKKLQAARDEGAPAVVVLADDVRAALARIEAEREGPGQISVLLLGRYTFSLPGPLGELARGFPALSLQFLTVHRSKGLQADYVVLLDVTSGRYGFPSEIADDPLLSMVLAEPDPFAHAEERRLFYVALTRARRRVFVLTRETQPSAFVEELLGPAYAGLVEGPARWAERPPCPECGGTLTERVSRSGQRFWGCLDYPYCEGPPRKRAPRPVERAPRP
jgi:DNA helicase-4